jgi:hypothetical protein
MFSVKIGTRCVAPCANGVLHSTFASALGFLSEMPGVHNLQVGG